MPGPLVEAAKSGLLMTAEMALGGCCRRLWGKPDRRPVGELQRGGEEAAVQEWEAENAAQNPDQMDVLDAIIIIFRDISM